MLEEPFVDAHVPRARFAPARPLRTSILWCVAIGLALMVMSMSFALVFDRGFYFYSQSTATMLAEAASAVPEVRARWAALHLQLPQASLGSQGLAPRAAMCEEDDRAREDIVVEPSGFASHGHRHGSVCG